MTYSTFADLLADTVEILRPPERLSVSEAAEKYRVLNNPGAYVGPWKNSTVPYMEEVMDTLDSREFNATVFAGPAQCAKTDIILNWLLHGVMCSPADFILYQTSMGVARDFRKRRVDRLHRHSPAMAAKLSGRSQDDNVFDTIYKSGMMFTLSWPTINELSGRPVGRVALTDYDRMPENVDGEGSPFDLGRKRTTTFGSFAMTFAESSPGYEVTNPKWLAQSRHEAPPSRGILALYNRGDRRRWYWPCIHCGEHYEPSFALIRWPDTKDEMEAGEAAKMMCPHCGGLMSPDVRHEVNQQGLWVPDNMTVDAKGVLHGNRPRSDIASFWLKGPAAAFSTWKTLVINYLKAEKEFEKTGSQEALKSTINTDQGEPFMPRGIGNVRDPSDLKSRAEEIADVPSVPDGVVALFATVDVQANRFEVQIQGVIPIGPGQMDVFVIDRFAIVKSNRKDDDGERYWVKPGSHLEDWDLLTEQVIFREYPLADRSGRMMGIKLTLCDSGGKAGVTTNAYDYYRKLRKNGMAARFQLVKGDARPAAPRISVTFPDAQRKDKKAYARGEIPILLINTNKVKDQLDHMLDRTEPGGRIRFADHFDDSFFVELTVEQKDEKGCWQNFKKLRNEAWDLLVYCLAGMSHLKLETINWDKPPTWLAPWDRNDFVRVPEVQTEKRFAPQKKTVSNLAQLAERLA